MSRNITVNDQEKHRRLRGIWDKKRGEGEITQTKAGKALGMSQAVIAQYLNCHIALNTDSVLAFAQYLGVHAADIDPALKDHFDQASSDVEVIEVPITATLSGAPVTTNPDGSYRTVKIVRDKQ